MYVCFSYTVDPTHKITPETHTRHPAIVNLLFLYHSVRCLRRNRDFSFRFHRQLLLLLFWFLPFWGFLTVLVSASRLVRVFGGAPWGSFPSSGGEHKEVSECTRAHASSVTLANHRAPGEPLLPTGQVGVRGVRVRQPALREWVTRRVWNSESMVGVRAGSIHQCSS